MGLNGETTALTYTLKAAGCTMFISLKKDTDTSLATTLTGFTTSATSATDSIKLTYTVAY